MIPSQIADEPRSGQGSHRGGHGRHRVDGASPTQSTPSSAVPTDGRRGSQTAERSPASGGPPASKRRRKASWAVTRLSQLRPPSCPLAGASWAHSALTRLLPTRPARPKCEAARRPVLGDRRAGAHPLAGARGRQSAIGAGPAQYTYQSSVFGPNSPPLL